jgi:uncharacterized protein YdeI (BOF family)
MTRVGRTTPPRRAVEDASGPRAARRARPDPNPTTEETDMTWNKLAIAAAALALCGASLAQDPHEALDRTWISLAGTVIAVTGPDTFTMSYGDGIVTIEMDDWDTDADALKIVKGDRVAVSGRVDDDMFESTTVEASSVYVESAGTYFYASAADEEDTFVTMDLPVDVSRTLVQGTVTRVDGRRFTVDTGSRRILVDTARMPYDPLDDTGLQQVRKGDVVSVSGTMNTQFWENRELDATSIIELHDAGTATG